MDLHAAVETTFGRKSQRRTAVQLPASQIAPVRFAAVSTKSILLALLLTFAVSSCGRSAPSDGIVAAPTSVPADGSLPEDTTDAQTNNTADVPSTEQMAGVRVVSDDQLVTATTVQTAVQTTSTTEAPTTAASTYVVQPGDTLSVIAERFNVPLSELSAANGIGDVDTIKPGQELVIPATG